MDSYWLGVTKDREACLTLILDALSIRFCGLVWQMLNGEICLAVQLNAHITSAKGDEQKQVMLLISAISKVCLGANLVLLEADKGYDCRKLRVNLLKCGIYPFL